MSADDRKKWNGKYADAANSPGKPSEVLRELTRYLLPRGRALDLAGGAGRNAIWLAQQGWDVTIADISTAGLNLAKDRAKRAEVHIHTLEIDLEREPLNAEPFDLILSVCYLCRHIFSDLSKYLGENGVLIVIQPTKKNLERHDKPPEAYLFEPGELKSLAKGFDVVHYVEDWSADGRHDAVLVARHARE